MKTHVSELKSQGQAERPGHGNHEHGIGIVVIYLYMSYLHVFPDHCEPWIALGYWSAAIWYFMSARGR
jgi:hypothetical protein